MFYAIKDRKIISSGSSYMEIPLATTYEFDFSLEPHFCSGCLIDVVDGVYTLTHNAECDKLDINEKLKRMQDIKIEIRNLGGVNVPTYTALDTANATRITELTTEFDALAVEVNTYSQTLIDDVLASFFS